MIDFIFEHFGAIVISIIVGLTISGMYKMNRVSKECEAVEKTISIPKEEVINAGQ